MKKSFLLFLFCIIYTNKAYAITALLRAELKRLDPQTRQEQRCDIAAMEYIANTHRFAPDKAIAYSFAEPIIKGNILQAPGAAFRASNNWYHLSFTCITSDDKLDVNNFSFKIGARIPKSEWNYYYLVP